MTTITEKLSQELEVAKLTLKFAKNVETICDAFNRKEDFSFKSQLGSRFDGYLFEDTYLDFGSVNATLSYVRHFEDSFFQEFGKKIDSSDLKKTISAIKFVFKNIDRDGFYSLAVDIKREKIK